MEMNKNTGMLVIIGIWPWLSWELPVQWELTPLVF